jgi:hypothetical protein
MLEKGTIPSTAAWFVRLEALPPLCTRLIYAQSTHFSIKHLRVILRLLWKEQFDLITRTTQAKWLDTIFQLKITYLHNERGSRVLLHFVPIVKVDHKSAILVNKYAPCQAIRPCQENN